MHLIKMQSTARYLKEMMGIAIPQAEGEMVEIGSYAGESARIFLDTGRIKRLWCIDPWMPGYDEKDPASYANILAVEGVFDQRVGGDGRVMKLKMTSAQAVSTFKDGSLDFVYIDGNHKYEFVRDDIEAYISKVKNGGYIGGHDYNLPDVKLAVHRFFLPETILTFGYKKGINWLYRI